MTGIGRYATNYRILGKAAREVAIDGAKLPQLLSGVIAGRGEFELVSDIDVSTRSMLSAKIAQGSEDGLLREDIIADIMSSNILSEERATLIADHEVAMANGDGAQTGWKEAIKAGVALP